MDSVIFEETPAERLTAEAVRREVDERLEAGDWTVDFVATKLGLVPAGVDAVMRGGAVAAQVGTALLLADEAGTHPVHRAALVDGAYTHTERTRAFTGRWARGLSNRFVREHADAPAGYPHLHHLTAPERAAALATGDAQTAHLWAGTGYRDIQSAPTREIIRLLTP